jgi:predicted RNA-binding protein with PUA-like domain
MACWLLKTEPGSYSWSDLVRDGRARWDGVANALAQKNLRATRRGDAAFFYHTGDEKSVVGLARVDSDPYPDPANPALVVIDLVPEAALPRPVALAAVKADPRFADFALVRLPRLSVMPVDATTRAALLALGGA